MSLVACGRWTAKRWMDNTETMELQSLEIQITFHTPFSIFIQTWESKAPTDAIKAWKKGQHLREDLCFLRPSEKKMLQVLVFTT